MCLKSKNFQKNIFNTGQSNQAKTSRNNKIDKIKTRKSFLNHLKYFRIAKEKEIELRKWKENFQFNFFQIFGTKRRSTEPDKEIEPSKIKRLKNGLENLSLKWFTFQKI